MKWFKRLLGVVDWHESAQEWAQIAKDAMALEARVAKTRDDFCRLYNVYKDRVSVLEAERDQLQARVAQLEANEDELVRRTNELADDNTRYVKQLQGIADELDIGLFESIRGKVREINTELTNKCEDIAALRTELAQVRGKLEVEQRLTEDMWKYAASDLDIRKARDITSLDDWRKKVK